MVHCCLLVWLAFVRFLEAVNNGFLWYGIPWWCQVFRSLENTNLWKRFVALHCFDTKTNDFFSVIGFEAWYIGWKTEVVFGGRKIRMVFVRFFISRWAGKLSIRRTTFLLLARKDEPSFLTHSSDKTPVIQLFFYALYRQGSCFTFLKHRGFSDLSITNFSNFSPVALATVMPVNLTLLFLRPEHFSLDRW